MGWTLVTGAAKRLGKEIALQLAAHKRNLLIHYRKSEKEAEEVANACRETGVEAQIIQGDFSSQKRTEAFIEQLHGLDVLVNGLVNNVGPFLVEKASETAPEEWEALFQTNCLAPMALARACFLSLKSEGGSVVNLGVAGLHRTSKLAPAYAAAKEALLSQTRALAREWGSDQIQVNMVSPGVLENSVVKTAITAVPMGRFGSCSEVARLIAFLMNPENRYITGQNIEIAGGFRL